VSFYRALWRRAVQKCPEVSNKIMARKIENVFIMIDSFCSCHTLSSFGQVSKVFHFTCVNVLESDVGVVVADVSVAVLVSMFLRHFFLC
jgi:hypothetical protein